MANFEIPRSIALQHVESWPIHGDVSVSSSIVDFLSSGLYRDPAACLKELVNNSYDADATVVDVLVKPDADLIIIADDGAGFTEAEFIRHFSRLSESHKRDAGDVTVSGRPTIGKIGIGFIAANELCEEMEIFTTKQGSTTVLHVVVDFSAMREPSAERKLNDSSVKKGDYYGERLDAPKGDHYTRIFLRALRGGARELFNATKRARGVEGEGASLYGLRPESIRTRLRAAPRSWAEFDFYSQTMLGLALNVPIRYASGWVPGPHRAKVRDLEDHVRDLGFRVNYDGTELYKPTVLEPGDARNVLTTFHIQGEKVSARGYLYAKHGTLFPTELNGVLIRIRNAAVGGYDPTFLDYPNSMYTLFQRWVSGELWADDRLEEAMNIDRATLRPIDPAFAELQTLFHQELERFLHSVRIRLYTEPTAEKRKLTARREAQQIATTVKRAPTQLSPAAKASVEREWLRDPDDPSAIRAVLRKYSVAEIYELVVDIAQDILSPRDAQRFLLEMTRRLRRRQ